LPVNPSNSGLVLGIFRFIFHFVTSNWAIQIFYKIEEKEKLPNSF